MKYNLGDALWIMRSNTAYQGVVIGRQYTQLAKSEDETYLLQYADGDVHWHHGGLLHKTRDELLASIGIGA